jgi:hypothetical protein
MIWIIDFSRKSPHLYRMKKILIAALSGALLLACQSNQETAKPQEPVRQEDHSGHQHETEEAAPALMLNNGEKWEANKETTAGVANMQAAMKQVPAEAKIEDYHKLKVKLEAEFDGIVESCNMTGEAHNQLHNFLLPLRDKFEGLGATDLEACKKSYAEIGAQLAEYEKYFK